VRNEDADSEIEESHTKGKRSPVAVAKDVVSSSTN